MPAIKASDGNVYNFPDEASANQIGAYLKSKGARAVSLAEETPTTAKGGPSLDQPESVLAKKRIAAEASVKSAKETMTGALPAAGAGAFVLASGGLGAIPMAGMAGLGGMLGESGRQTLNRSLGLEAPATGTQAAKEIGIVGAEQTVMELGGAGVTWLAKKAINLPWKQLVAKASTPESQAVIGIADKLGIKLTIPEATGVTPLKMIQNVADRSLMGRSQAFMRKKEQYDAVVHSVNDTLDAVGPNTSPMATGVKMKNAFEAMDEAIDKQADKLYRKADELIPNDTPVDLKLAQRITKSNVAASAPAAKEFPGVSSHTSKYENIAADFTKKESEVAGIDISKFPPAAQQQIREQLGLVTSGTASWQATRKMLSDLKTLVREKETPKDAVTLAKQLIPAVQRSMQKAARKIGPEAEEAILTADTFYREGKELTRDTVIPVLRDKDPSAMAAAVRSPEDVAAVRHAIVDVAKQPAAFSAFQRQRMQTYLSDPSGTGELALNKLGDNLRKVGKEQLEEEFGKDAVGREALKNMTDLSQVVARVDHLMRPPTRGGTMPTLHEYGDVNRVVNMTATAMVLSTGITAVKRLGREATGLLAAPLMNRVMANPKLARQLINGVDLLPMKYGAGITQIERALEVAARELYGGSQLAASHKTLSELKQ